MVAHRAMRDRKLSHHTILQTPTVSITLICNMMRYAHCATALEQGIAEAQRQQILHRSLPGSDAIRNTRASSKTAPMPSLILPGGAQLSPSGFFQHNTGTTPVPVAHRGQMLGCPAANKMERSPRIEHPTRSRLHAQGLGQAGELYRWLTSQTSCNPGARQNLSQLALTKSPCRYITADMAAGTS